MILQQMLQHEFCDTTVDVAGTLPEFSDYPARLKYPIHDQQW